MKNKTKYLKKINKLFLKSRQHLVTCALVPMLLLMLCAWNVESTFAVVQTPLLGKNIPKYLTTISDAAGSNLGLVDGTLGPITVTMEEAQQMILPASFYLALPVPYNAGTYVWQYTEPNTLYPGGTRDTYLGPVILTERGIPLNVTYINTLGLAGLSNVLFYRDSVDQTLHWADPLHQHGSFLPYADYIPAVVHLHGGEVKSEFDGGPDSWFTSQAANGDTYNATLPSTVGPAFSGGNTFNQTYTYPNGQEAAPIWFHDHTLGATRLHVYAGLAGAYLIKDPPGAANPTEPANLPAPVPLVIQDRMFDTNGQLYFPNLGINPTVHPFWIPEFFGDVIVVNGKSWPKMQVDPKRYDFIILNGSNARFYELSLGKGGPAFWVIGTDGGYLDKPVKIAYPNKLLIAPGERYEVIIDFAGFVAGTTFTMTNTAKAPYPKGAAPDPKTVGQIMQFVVSTNVVTDNTCNPVAGVNDPKGGCIRPNTMVRLVNPTTGILNVTPLNTRKLTLNEVMGAAGPLEVLVNNTKWDGMMSPNAGGITELPQVGSSEVWEIINLTADAHPIHLHLTQFQLISRQAFNTSGYNKLYTSLFPGGTSPVDGLAYPAGVFIPGYGSPKLYNFYNTGATPWFGGNPDYTPFLKGNPSLPKPYEAGWKDTVIMYPGEVTRITVRWTPQSTLVGSEIPGTSQYGFDPTTGPGYVWHCHIIDHEDNEMMRPYKVSATAQ